MNGRTRDRDIKDRVRVMFEGENVKIGIVIFTYLDEERAQVEEGGAGAVSGNFAA